MKLKFRMSKEVRVSLAGEAKKLSWVGAVVYTAIGWHIESPYFLALVAAWFVYFEAAAHILLSIQGSKDDAND